MKISNDIVISSRIRLARNLEEFPFPNAIRDERTAHRIIEKVEGAIRSTGGEFRKYTMADLKTYQAEALKERHMISEDLISHARIGAALIDEQRGLSFLINEEDVLREQCIMDGFALKEAFALLHSLDEKISERIPFAFHPEKGYLTACPTNLGTGMRASVMLFLPALAMTNSMQSVILSARKFQLTVRGVYGEGSTAAGYMFQISNEVTLGVSEEEIITNVEAVVNKICQAEMNARETIMQVQPLELKDKVCRAFGILSYAARIDSAEFMSLIADVKLGSALGLLPIAYSERLNQLCVEMQPANISVAAARELSPEERDVYRAETCAKTMRELAR